ncbi:hypothetical protein ONA91_20795 [Micromonospora sp. DR5-3]|uniref:hypothetical protein n=1 Tax=unclassified Micromonospora TaxID=2617518 RepID=UPI0011DC45AE|nr:MULTISPECIES: hypothetical protein [unclassified Micromonospora]MCW3816888.1 hypothetical protein [Micromonospora sp. DR5-3]TYC23394.1 hypothetical protein FXF52_15450 [Micromonospora sp. MP36]
MGIPVSLRESLHDPLFWARYTFAAEDGPGADRLGALEELLDEDDDDDDERDTALNVVFDVGGGHLILLDVDTRLGSYELGITGPGSVEPAGLGWDDLAHWHPYALRWSELDLICRAVAVRNPLLSHPGVPLALLCRFAAVFEDDDVDAAVTTVDSAYGALRPQGWDGYWPSGADWLERADFRGEKVVWHRDEAGNLWAEQDDHHDADFYSTRVTPPAEAEEHFPHTQLRKLLAAAATTVATGSRP